MESETVGEYSHANKAIASIACVALVTGSKRTASQQFSFLFFLRVEVEHTELFVSTCQRSKLVSRLLRGSIIAEVRFRLSTTNLTTLYTPPLRKLVNEARQLAPARVGKRPAPDEQILALLKTAARAFLARDIGLAGICRPPFSFCVYTLCCVTDSSCVPGRTFELLLH